MRRFLIASTLVGLVVGVGIALEPEAGATHITKCFGEKADVNRSHDPGPSFQAGTAGHDVIIGSRFADEIKGKGGRDFICGIGGGDVILGGDQADKLNGGRGKDELSGGPGNDLLIGGPRHDRGRGGPGTDTCVSIEVRRSCEIVL